MDCEIVPVINISTLWNVFRNGITRNRQIWGQILDLKSSGRTYLGWERPLLWSHEVNRYKYFHNRQNSAAPTAELPSPTSLVSLFPPNSRSTALTMAGWRSRQDPQYRTLFTPWASRNWKIEETIRVLCLNAKTEHLYPRLQEKIFSHFAS